MKKSVKKLFALLICAVMVFGSAPLDGIADIDFPSLASLFSTKASAEENTSGVYDSGYGWRLYNDGELVINENLSDFSNTNYPTWHAYPEKVLTARVESGVTYIPDSLFADCTYLQTVTFPDTIQEMGGGIFYNCQNLENLDAPTRMLSLDTCCYSRMGVDNRIITWNVGMFENCYKINSILIADSVTSISMQAFCCCSSLTQIIIPETVTTIGRWAFSYCSSLTQIIIPTNVTAIGEMCFACCTSLKEIELPDSVATTQQGNRGEGCFYGCTSLEKAIIGSGVHCLDKYKVGGILNNYTKKLIPSKKENTSCGFFEYCTALKEVVFKSNIDLMPLAFYGCINLESIDLTKVSNVLGFSGCVKLKQVSFSNNLVSVNSDAFLNCVSLENVIYEGTQSDFEAKVNLTGNEYLLAANRHYNHIHDEHTNTYRRDFVQETCESAGFTGDLCCAECGWIFEKGEYREALGHDYQTTAIDPTCTSNGIQVTACSRCGRTTIDSVSPATGHSYKSKIVRPTCTDGGYTLNVCSYCGLSTITDETEPLGHDYVETVMEATCTRDGYTVHKCSRCNASYIDGETPAFGHTYVDTEITSTCTGVGYTSHKCSTCGDEYITNETPAKGHNYEPVTVPATCETAGYVIYICSDCGMAYRGETLPAKGHSYRDEIVVATCTAGGYTVHTCEACGNTVIDSRTPATGHDYTETTVEATCTTNGCTRHECKHCHDFYETDIVPAHGHSMKTAVVEPTCTTGGFTISSCTNCGYSSITNETTALGHDYQPSVVIEHTCIQDGCTLNICSHCGGVSKTEGLPATGHSFGVWQTVEYATEEHEGLQQRHCENCGYCEDRLLPIVNRTTFNVTFKADGETVAVVEYVKGSSSIEEPPVPHKDRFEGRWESYSLNDEDITVNAVYSVIDLDNISGVDTGESATYNASTGVATINMFAASQGKTVISTSSEAVPLDIILVVDQSGSMDEKLGSGMTKKQALINSANAFVGSVYDDAVQYDVGHRIAIVGFGMGNKSGGVGYPAYLNTEILTTGGKPVQMDKAKASDYAAALMTVNNAGTLNPGISTAINNIDANGATAADYGLSMANSIFANCTDSEGRQRVVVFMTDGAPTYSSAFSKDVANAAILQANELKNAYGAAVYSVGVMSDSDSNNNIKQFMNYVSSNYKNAKALGGKADYVCDNYYYNVNNTGALSGVFTKIVTENITRTTDFDNITMIETVSKYFTLTSQQEKAMRISAIEQYGVTNEDIDVVRNTNGTTTITIRNMHPVDNGSSFVIDLSFEVSANENAAAAGVYPIGTDDSGIMLGSEENYEFVFTVPYVTVPAERGTAVFRINGEVYAIKTTVNGELPTAPETDFEGQYEFSGWTVPADSMKDGYAVYDATYAAQECVIIWNTEDGTQKVIVTPGDVITEPTVGENSSGDAFRRWNGEVPTTMPGHSIEFTAVYGDHEHNYIAETVTPMTCLSNGLIRYTCSVCGDTYEEVTECPGEHTWVVATSASDDNEAEQIIVCERCGMPEDRMLQYSNSETEANERGYTEAIAHELNLVDSTGACYQPNGTVNISMPVDGSCGSCYDVSVYRLGKNGERIACSSEYDNGVVSFGADHFSTYIFVPLHFCSITGKHIDENNDNYCDICDEKIKETAGITFVVDGEVISSGEYIVGSATIIPDAPEKEGFIFSGWSPEISETVESGDTTYVAAWSAPEHICTGVVIGAHSATCNCCGSTGDTYCSVCGRLMEAGETIPATGHNYGDWSSWKNTDSGTKARHRTCTDCGHRDVEQKTVINGGRHITLDRLLDYIFTRIFNSTLGRIFNVKYKSKYGYE